MSIRLRLTLLYSLILALTLVTFGSILYVTQSRATLSAIMANLAGQAAAYAKLGHRPPPPNPDLPRPEGSAPANATPRPSPDGSRSGSDSSTVATLPGRWTQIRNPQGTIIGRTADLADTPLPLSDAGLAQAKSGVSVVESAIVDAEPILILSQPVTLTEGVSVVVQVAAVMTEREQSLSTLRVILIAGSLLVILVAFGVGWMLSGMALGPIHQITRTAQAIGAERNFGRRVQHSGPNDEIGQLAVTFNTMLTELESTYRQVEKALEAQRRFVADASHELRTPLTTVRGNIELLRHEPPMEPREAADVLADTKEEVERLIRLVHQLLVLARADAGRPLRCKPVPIEQVLQDVLRQARLLAPSRTITGDIELDVSVLADRDAFKQVMLILADNAVVHTPPDASIHIQTQLVDGRVSVSVHDTGPGIPPAQLAHIFERFYRGDAARSGGGTGLGLAIAQELVKAQNGELAVTSEPGKGTEFTLLLPRDGLSGGVTRGTTIPAREMRTWHRSGPHPGLGSGGRTELGQRWRASSQEEAVNLDTRSRMNKRTGPPRWLLWTGLVLLQLLLMGSAYVGGRMLSPANSRGPRSGVAQLPSQLPKEPVAATGSVVKIQGTVITVMRGRVGGGGGGATAASQTDVAVTAETKYYKTATGTNTSANQVVQVEAATLSDVKTGGTILAWGDKSGERVDATVVYVQLSGR